MQLSNRSFLPTSLAKPSTRPAVGSTASSPSAPSSSAHAPDAAASSLPIPHSPLPIPSPPFPIPPLPYPFRNCIVLGLMLGEDGQNMSKSKRNYREPNEIFDRYGADCAALVFLLPISRRGPPIRYSEQAIRTASLSSCCGCGMSIAFLSSTPISTASTLPSTSAGNAASLHSQRASSKAKAIGRLPSDRSWIAGS